MFYSISKVHLHLAISISPLICITPSCFLVYVPFTSHHNMLILLKELAQLIPDVNTRLEEIPTYTKCRESQKIIYSTRKKLEQLEPPSYSSAAGASSSVSPYDITQPASSGSREMHKTYTRRVSQLSLSNIVC